MKLTKRQAEILKWVKGYIGQHGYAPTMEEIAEAFGLWRTGVSQHLSLIERKGYIKRTPHVARGLVVLS